MPNGHAQHRRRGWTNNELPDYQEACRAVQRLRDAVAPGSYLVIADGASTSAQIAEGARVSAEGGHAYTLRTLEQIAHYFVGWDLVAPGVLRIPCWRPDRAGPVDPDRVDGYRGVAHRR